MATENVLFQYRLGDRIQDAKRGVSGTVTSQDRDSRGVGYWIAFLDANGRPCELFVPEGDAKPA